MVCKYWREEVKDEGGVWVRTGYRCVKLNKEVLCFANIKYCEASDNDDMTGRLGLFATDELYKVGV